MFKLVVGKFEPVLTGIVPVLTMPRMYDHSKSAITTAPLVAISETVNPTKSTTACCAASCEFRTTSVDVVPLRYDKPLCMDKKFEPNIRS